MKKFLITFLLLATFFLKGDVVLATNYAECDACGLCQKKIQDQNVLLPTPGSWKSCRDCIYPGAEGMETLIVDPASGAPPAPAIGRHYTSIGCINTSLADFTQPGAAGSLATVLLNFIFRIAGGVAFLYILYGSFLILTSQSSPERLEQGKKTVLGAIVGLVFVLLSVFIVNLITGQILKIPDVITPSPTPISSP
jgi:hypothetical protein